MKKALALIAAAGLMAAATTAMAAPVSIVNSKHNVSASGPGSVTGSGTQICIYCHTPHNALAAGGPIWNRKSNQFNVTYQLYSGTGMTNISNKSGFTSDSISLFCMSCHDGSAMGGTMLVNLTAAIGTDEYNAVNNFTSGIATSSKANLAKGDASQAGGGTTADGSLLKTTHPVNFAMTAGGGDLATPSAFKITGLKGKDFPLYKSARSATQSFECSSCHAVHDNEFVPFLRDTNSGSKLCLGCHNK